MKKLSSVMKEIPSEARFTIQMAADSTTEVWTDITTHLEGNDGWHILGLEWDIESVSPTVPLQWPTVSSNDVMVLQIHRRIDQVTLLNQTDDDLLLTSVVRGTVASGVGWNVWETPVTRDFQTVTTQKKLRVMFRTAVDNASINGTTNQLVGRIFYHLVEGPNVGVTKLGKLKEF